MLAQFSGNKLRELALTSDTDTTDLLGCFEQVDLRRRLRRLVTRIGRAVHSACASLAVTGGAEAMLEVGEISALHAKMTRALAQPSSAAPGGGERVTADSSADGLSDGQTTAMLQLLDRLESLASARSLGPSSAGVASAAVADASASLAALGSEAEAVRREVEALRVIAREQVTGCFEWMDGLLVKALKDGDWVLLDKANLCNPTVLDRLNPLLEPNGVLMINERGLVDGRVTVVRPHSDFRIFMCMDPRHGEVSRAMRNRGVEVALLEDQIAHRDLGWLVEAAGLAGGVLAEAAVDLHRAVAAAARTSSGPRLNVRYLLQWSTAQRSLLQRGMSPREAWVQATDLVYGAAGQGQDWRDAVASLSETRYARACELLVTGAPLRVTGLVDPWMLLRDAVGANRARDSLLLYDVVCSSIRAQGGPARDPWRDPLASCTFSELVGASDPAAAADAPAARLMAATDSDAESDAAGGTWEATARIAARLVVETSSIEDLQHRRDLLRHISSLRLSPAVSAAALEAAAAIELASQHFVHTRLRESRSELAAGIKSEERKSFLCDQPWDLRHDAAYHAEQRLWLRQGAHDAGRGLDDWGQRLAGAGGLCAAHQVWMERYSLVLFRIFSSNGDDGFLSQPLDAVSEAARTSVAGICGARSCARRTDVLDWARPLLQRMDQVMEGWLQLPDPFATSIAQLQQLRKLWSRLALLRKKIPFENEGHWMAIFLVLWRWILKECRELLDPDVLASCGFSHVRVEGGDSESESPSRRADSEARLRLPEDVTEMVCNVSRLAPLSAFEPSLLWLHGGHPRVRTSPEALRLREQLVRHASYYTFAWARVSDEGHGQEPVFPLGVLCLSDAFKRALVQGFAGVESVETLDAESELFRTLRDLPAWLQTEGDECVATALGARGRESLGQDGLAAIPVSVDAVRFPVWKAGLWPLMDHSSVEAEQALLVLTCSYLLGGESESSQGGRPDGAAEARGAEAQDGMSAAAAEMKQRLEDFISFGIAHTSRSAADFCAYQKLVWLVTAGVGHKPSRQEAKTRSESAAGILQEMLISWHARQWNASFEHVQELCQARILPFDAKPARLRRDEAGTDTASAGRRPNKGLGPAAALLPVQSINAVYLQQRWLQVTVASRGAVLAQMRGLAIHLAGHASRRAAAPAATASGGAAESLDGRKATGPAQEAGSLESEVRLVWEMLAQLVSCYAQKWRPEEWTEVEQWIRDVRGFLDSSEREGKGLCDWASAKQALVSVRDSRAQALFKSCIIPALDILVVAIESIKGDGEDAARWIGQVWGLVGTCRLHLVALASPVDPSAKFAVKLGFVEARLEDVRRELDALQRQAELSGRVFCERRRGLEGELAALGERRSKLARRLVPRPARPSFESLHRELHHFCSTIADADKMIKMMQVGGQPCDAAAQARLVQEEEQWQGVADMFCARLERDYGGYRDVTVPHMLAVHEMRRGLRLIALHARRREHSRLGPSSPALLTRLLRFPLTLDVDNMPMIEQVVLRTGATPPCLSPPFVCRDPPPPCACDTDAQARRRKRSCTVPTLVRRRWRSSGPCSRSPPALAARLGGADARVRGPGHVRGHRAAGRVERGRRGGARLCDGGVPAHLERAQAVPEAAAGRAGRVVPVRRARAVRAARVLSAPRACCPRAVRVAAQRVCSPRRVSPTPSALLRRASRGSDAPPQRRDVAGIASGRSKCPRRKRWRSGTLRAPSATSAPSLRTSSRRGTSLWTPTPSGPPPRPTRRRRRTSPRRASRTRTCSSSSTRTASSQISCTSRAAATRKVTPPPETPRLGPG